MSEQPAGAPSGAYSESDLRRVREIAKQRPFRRPEDLRQVLDGYGYLGDWRESYRIQSVRSSLRSSTITCVDAAILSYGLLELLFPDTKRRLLAIHRRDPSKDEECGHCVALYWNEAGRVGSLSKSNYEGLGHRDSIFDDEVAVASSYAEAYVAMGFQPLYFGVTTLEEAAPDLDWRLSADPLNQISDRLQATYAYGFGVE